MASLRKSCEWAGQAWVFPPPTEWTVLAMWVVSLDFLKAAFHCKTFLYANNQTEPKLSFLPFSPRSVGPRSVPWDRGSGACMPRAMQRCWWGASFDICLVGFPHEPQEPEWTCSLPCDWLLTHVVSAEVLVQIMKLRDRESPVKE